MQEYSTFVLGKNLVVLAINEEQEYTVSRNLMKRFVDPSYENSVEKATVEIFVEKEEAKAYFLKIVGTIVNDYI